MRNLPGRAGEDFQRGCIWREYTEQAPRSVIDPGVPQASSVEELLPAKDVEARLGLLGLGMNCLSESCTHFFVVWEPSDSHPVTRS